METYQHAYDRLGNPLKKKHVHTASGKTTRTEELAYTYDSGARPTKVTHKLNSGTTVTLATYSYDEFCRLANKKLHGSSNSNNQQGYSYNLHGWMTTLTNPNYNLSLTYNSGSVGFNGNITGMYWVTPSGGHMYSFTYDGLNCMLNANHVSGQYTEKVTGYDKNGNILGLQRYGQTGASSYGLVDNLTYTYNGNKLTRVDDAVTATSYTGGTNFINGASTNNEYTYDQNGNLTKDSNKGIANITYNLLSLPQVVTFSDGSTIRYMYSADGTKLRTTHVINGVTTTTDYCGNVIYENGTAKRLLNDEGYFDLINNTYYYYLKDHQGNNRVVINSSGTVQETNHYYPFGGLFATNGSVQPYKYNGKELDTKKGLNLYDYGARHYDAALGRWHVVDPMAEKMGAWSPYGYCFNNPMKFVDEEGEFPWLAALVGGAIDYGAQVAVNLYQGKSISESLTQVDMKSVAVSALASATGVGLGNVISKGVAASRVAQASANAGKVLSATMDVAKDAAISVGEQVAKGESVSSTKVLNDVLFGASSKTLGGKTKSLYQNSKQGKQLENKARELENSASKKKQTQRAIEAKEARNIADSYGDGAKDNVENTLSYTKATLEHYEDKKGNTAQ